MGENWVLVTVTEKYWRKHNDQTVEGMLKRWDERKHNLVHLKIHVKPIRTIDVVCVNLNKKLRGTFRVHDVTFLSLKYLKQHDLEGDFGPGVFIRCEGITWKRLLKEVPHPPNRGFRYIKPLH